MQGREEETIIVGRSVSDYARSGVTVPKGAQIVPCRSCNASVALGATGQEMLKTKRRAYVFCTPCIEIIANKGPLPITKIYRSADMREQAGKSPGVASRLADLERKLKPED
jgi:hypothetical protein